MKVIGCPKCYSEGNISHTEHKREVEVEGEFYDAHKCTKCKYVFLRKQDD